MADIDIDYYCRAYDDFLSPADCEEYIDKYEETLRVDNERGKNLAYVLRMMVPKILLVALVL